MTLLNIKEVFKYKGRQHFTAGEVIEHVKKYYQSWWNQNHWQQQVYSVGGEGKTGTNRIGERDIFGFIASLSHLAHTTNE